MYRIKYYTMIIETVKDEERNTQYVQVPQELYFECKDSELEKWIDYIKKAYGENAEVTHEYIDDELTKEELTIKTINNLTIENKKKDILIASLAEQINNLNIKLTQLGGSENV